jgi:hypothetical protein
MYMFIYAYVYLYMKMYIWICMCRTTNKCTCVYVCKDSSNTIYDSLNAEFMFVSIISCMKTIIINDMFKPHLIVGSIEKHVKNINLVDILAISDYLKLLIMIYYNHLLLSRYLSFLIIIMSSIILWLWWWR